MQNLYAPLILMKATKTENANAKCKCVKRAKRIHGFVASNIDFTQIKWKSHTMCGENAVNFTFHPSIFIWNELLFAFHSACSLFALCGWNWFIRCNASEAPTWNSLAITHKIKSSDVMCFFPRFFISVSFRWMCDFEKQIVFFSFFKTVERLQTWQGKRMSIAILKLNIFTNQEKFRQFDAEILPTQVRTSSFFFITDFHSQTPPMLTQNMFCVVWIFLMKTCHTQFSIDDTRKQNTNRQFLKDSGVSCVSQLILKLDRKGGNIGDKKSNIVMWENVEWWKISKSVVNCKRTIRINLLQFADQSCWSFC